MRLLIPRRLRAARLHRQVRLRASPRTTFRFALGTHSARRRFRRDPDYPPHGCAPLSTGADLRQSGSSTFTLDWLWLCSTGCFWWDHWLCKSR
ncbi:transmembrane protein 14C isoform X2 [Callorhinus ursinus]|uniref:transmembrane protein 14C isoform X2 n=1 Tax=Callorhinus ursinus TaxID=34884 RepID=UPI003CD008CF